MKRKLDFSDNLLDLYDDVMCSRSWGVWDFVASYHDGGWGRYFEVECACCMHHETFTLSQLYEHPSCTVCQANDFIEQQGKQLMKGVCIVPKDPDD